MQVAQRIQGEGKGSGGQDDEEDLDYRGIKDSYYYAATVVLFLTEAGLAIAIPDVEIIFNFVSAIAISTLGFLLPAVFFLAAERKFKIDTKIKQANGFHRKMAWLHLFLGVLVFLFSMF